MTSTTEKFNYLVLIISAALVISVFARFTNPIGIQSALFLFLGAVFCMEFNTYKADYKNFLLPALIFVMIAAVSYYFCGYPFGARNGILLVSYSLAAYMLCGFMSEYDKRSVMLIPVFISLWLTIYLFASNFAFGELLKPQALSSHILATACFLLVSLCLSFIFWWSEQKIYFYTSFILFAAIALTKSMLAVAIASLAFAVFLFMMREKIKIRSFFAVFPFCAVFVYSSYTLVKNGFFAQKARLWNTAFEVIKGEPFTGTGIGNYEAVSLKYSLAQSGAATDASNMFLQITAETGIAGLLALLGVIAVFFYFIFKKLKRKNNRVLYLPVLIAALSFMIFNFFESSAFISTNLLLFFLLLAFPLEKYKIKNRKFRINFYILVLLFLPVAIAAGKPVYSRQEYNKGIMFFSANKFSAAQEHFFNALKNDPLNPEYPGKLSDIYYALYQKTENPIDLNMSLEFALRAWELNKYGAKYYYQLAWLYHFKGETQLASDNISQAVLRDKNNELYLSSYGTLIN